MPTRVDFEHQSKTLDVSARLDSKFNRPLNRMEICISRPFDRNYGNTQKALSSAHDSQYERMSSLMTT